MRVTNPVRRPGFGSKSGELGCAIVVIVVIISLLIPAVQKVRESANRQAAPKKMQSVLDSQLTAWNAGDLDGFMAGYWNNEELKFLSGDTVTKGWQATHDRYVKRYKSDGKEMGQLTFSELDFEPLNGDAAIARGRWALSLKDGSNPHGLFTLLFRRIDGEWKIVSDHTSAAEPPEKDEKK